MTVNKVKSTLAEHLIQAASGDQEREGIPPEGKRKKDGAVTDEGIGGGAGGGGYRDSVSASHELAAERADMGFGSADSEFVGQHQDIQNTRPLQCIKFPPWQRGDM